MSWSLADLFDLLQLPDNAFAVKASVLLCWGGCVEAGNGILCPLPLKSIVRNKTQSELARA